MPNVLERQQDILSIISELDISPTMYSNAVEKYKAITAYLESYGIEAEMYPQGSFAFGTVVRPTSKSADANYDLDFICQIKGDRSSPVSYTHLDVYKRQMQRAPRARKAPMLRTAWSMKKNRKTGPYRRKSLWKPRKSRAPQGMT